VELSEVLGQLRVDIGDPDGTVFTDAECRRALARAVTRVNLDLGTSYALSDTELAPDPTSEHLELLLLAAHANLAGMRRSTSATTGFSFQSGDKRVDKTKAASSWAELWDALWDEYRRLVSKLTGQPVDDDILTPQGPIPVIYEVESEVDPWES
jgi:hypothetical protein